MKLEANTVKFYTWNDFRLAYEVSDGHSEHTPALLLIHPIGVGLDRCFWDPFIEVYLASNRTVSIYNPDLLGCGRSDLPRLAYYPNDWARQLQYFIETVIKKPTVIIVQGASAPIALNLVKNCCQSHLIKGVVFSGPPSWKLITKKANPLQQKLLWNLLFDSPLGAAFYLYARRRKFLQSFSVRQLFANPEAVDERWLDTLKKGATDLKTRHAVFSFLAGFWIEDYSELISNISQPTLVVFGEKASSISKTGAAESPERRLELYLKYLPNSRGKIIPGRNVMPYESADDFVRVVSDFIQELV